MNRSLLSGHETAADRVREVKYLKVNSFSDSVNSESDRN